VDQKVNYKVAIIDPVGKKAGMDHYDYSLAKELSAAGIRTIIFSNFSKEKIAINQFRFSIGGKYFRGAIMLISFLNALARARRRKVEVVILHIFHSAFLDRMFVSTVKKRGFKLFIIVHDIENTVRNGTSLKKICDSADQIIVHNNFSKSELQSKISQTAAGKISVIPHGHYIDLVQLDEIKLAVKFQGGNVYLLFFGLIKNSKGLDVLLDAMKILPDKIHLVIAGRIRDVDEGIYRKSVKEWNMQNRVHLLFRYITNRERNYLFKRCDIAVLPYKKIYQSGNLIMSMSYHLPVIVSDLPPNREVINESNGELFISGDARDLASKILSMCDRDRRWILADKAYDYVRMNHGWKMVSNSFAKLIS
jgi:D-inositol-3-phosphate glycosyltransferase